MKYLEWVGWKFYEGYKTVLSYWKSWTMRGVVLGILIEAADAYFKLLPDSMQGTPKVIIFGAILAVLRARTM